MRRAAVTGLVRGRQGGVGDDERGDGRPSADERSAAAGSPGRGVAGAGGEGEAGDDDRGDESPGDGLEDPGHREAGGVAAGECGGDLDGERDDQDGPGDPHDHGEGVDEGLGRDALAVEGPADLRGGGNVVREGPADEVPQRPRDAADQDGEQHEGAEAFDDAGDVGSWVRLARRWQCRCPITVM